MQTSASVIASFRSFAPSLDANEDTEPHTDPRERNDEASPRELFRRAAACPIPLSVSAIHLLNESAR